MKVGRLPDGPFTLDQLLTFETSSRWGFNQDEFRTIRVLLDESMPALLRIEIETYDTPDWIEADRLDYCLQLPEGKYQAADTARDGIEDRVFSYFVETESGNLMLLWKRGMVLGDYFRIATFGLQIPREAWDTAEGTLIKQTVMDIVATVTFAPDVMPTDRIAPSARLKQTSVSTVLRFRVPGEWTRGKLEDWTVFDSGDPRLGVFEAKYNWLPFSLRPDVGDRRTRLLSMLYADHPGLEGAADWVVFRSIDHDFKPPELTIVYRRIFFRGDWDFLDVWFCYRVDARRAEDPEVRDLIALFDREVRQAVIEFPAADEGAPAEVPA